MEAEVCLQFYFRLEMAIAKFKGFRDQESDSEQRLALEIASEAVEELETLLKKFDELLLK